MRPEDRDNPLGQDDLSRLPRWDLIAGVALAIVVAIASIAAPGAGVRALMTAADALLAPKPADAASPPPPEPPIAQQNAQAPPSAAMPPL